MTTQSLPNPVTEACETCPLGIYHRRAHTFNPCPSEINHKAKTIIVGDAPKKQDVMAGRAWTDRYGAGVVDKLKKLGVHRHDVSWANVVACRWPRDDAKSFLAGLKIRNRRRKRKGQPEHPTPMRACEGRLRADLSDHTNCLPMGDIATKAILHGNPTFSDVRGGPREVSLRVDVSSPYDWTLRVLPTFHPEQLAYQPKYKPVLASDLAKAFRYFKDKLNWIQPEVHWNPKPRDLQRILNRWKRLRKIVWYDVETDALEALNADLRCVGLGTESDVVMIHFLSRDRETKFYEDSIGPWAGTLQDERDTRVILTELFADPTVTKGGHNAGYYDRLVIEQHFGVTPAPLIDTIILHKLAESEYPHGLGYIGSVWTDVPAWKSEHTATEARTDYELGSYCATDVAVTARVAKGLKAKAKARKQRHLYATDAINQDICVGMHRMGIRIDEGRRQAHETKQLIEAEKQLNLLPVDLNPNSHDQVRALLFDKWALPPHQFTMGGLPSTNAASLIALLSNPLVDEEQRATLTALRRYRKAQKLLTTYLMKFNPEGYTTKGGKHHQLVFEGRVYPNWNSTGTVTGRFSAELFQTFPKILRDCFIPDPGHAFVYADFDQLELRLCAAIAGMQHYLDVFLDQVIGPHNMTGELMFGQDFWGLAGAPADKMKKGTLAFEKARDVAKAICFMSLYGAIASTVHENLVATEDMNGNLPFSGYTLREVRTLHRRLLRAVPELPLWWDKCLKHWRQTGYIEEPITRRRRYFHEEDFNAIPNFVVQSGGFAIVAKGMRTLVKSHIPFDGGNVGLVNQLHDAVLFQVRETDAEESKAAVVSVLEREELGMKFTVDAAILSNWGEK